MNDSIERDAFREDRLPDVRPARADVDYTRFIVSDPERAGEPRTPAPALVDEPAWWEIDEAAPLPDVRRWRAGSIIDSHLPLLLRTALNSTTQRQGGWAASRSVTGDLDAILGGSRYGSEDAVPVWTDADTIRERTSWKDESSTDGGGRRQKRGKRNRQDRPSDRHRSQGSR